MAWYRDVANSTRAPLSTRIVRTSVALYAVSSGTTTAPSRKAPRYAAIHRAPFGARIATRSPCLTPAIPLSHQAMAAASAMSDR